MIEITYTNNAGVSLTIPNSDYMLNQLKGIENTNQNVFTQKSPGIDGAQFIGSLYDMRDIIMECGITPGTIAELYTKRAALNFALNDRNVEGSLQISITTSTGIISYQINCVASSIKFAPKDLSVATQRFQVTFKCANPFFNILPLKTTTLGLTTPGLTFPMTFPVVFSTTTGTNIATVNNAGNIEAGLIITLTGPATNPTITNNTTGEYLKFIGLTLAIGQVMTITTGRVNQVDVNTGTGDNNGFQYLDLNSTFFNIAPGNNTIVIYDDLGFQYGTCVLSWYDQITGI